jgi:hypothetical protein
LYISVPYQAAAIERLARFLGRSLPSTGENGLCITLSGCNIDELIRMPAQFSKISKGHLRYLTEPRDPNNKQQENKAGPDCEHI